MPVYQLSSAMLGEFLGLTSDAPGADETSLATIHVRLDQMWREAAGREPKLVLLDIFELEKLRQQPDWSLRFKLIASPTYKFVAERQVPEHILQELNVAPLNFVRQLASRPGVLLVHSPQLFHRRTGREWELCVWLRVASAALNEQPPVIEDTRAGERVD